MASLLEQLKAKQAAAKKEEAAEKAPAPAKSPSLAERLGKKPVPAKTEAEVIEECKEAEEAIVEMQEQSSLDGVIMGITQEDLQQRIAYVYEHAKTAEKHEIKEDMNGLKRAIVNNPSIVAHLLPEDIGQMVAVLRKIHSEARAAASVTPAAKRAAKSAEAKAVKDLLKKPLQGAELDNLLDEL